jgi:hypothetical protein
VTKRLIGVRRFLNAGGSLVTASGRFGRKEVKQMIYAVLAALLCFVGPTYFAAVLSKVVPLMYAMILGFVCLLVGIILVLRLVSE